jgi:hypothetical protein
LPLHKLQEGDRLGHGDLCQLLARGALTNGTPASYQSSAGVTRTFCAGCDTPISYESARWPGEVHLFLCTLDTPMALSAQAHVFVGEQLAWLHPDDGLPRHATTGDAGPPLA